MLYMAGNWSDAPTVTFDLDFATPYTIVSFTRVEMRGEQPYSSSSGIVFPAWSVTALDAQGNALCSVGEGIRSTYSDIPAQTFQLESYPGTIAAIRIHGDPEHWAGEWGPIIDDLTLNPVPEPSVCAMLMLGGGTLLGIRRFKHASRRN